MFKTLFYVFGTWLLIIGAIYTGTTSNNYFIKFICFLVISSRQYALLLLMHDGIHYALCTSKKLNDFIAKYLLAVPVGALFNVGRLRHALHHKSTGDDNDPDKKFYFIKKGEKNSFFSHLKKTISFLVLNYSILAQKNISPPPEHVKSKINRFDFLELAIFHFSILLIFYFFTNSYLNYFFFWFFPILNFAFFFDKFRLFCEHTPLPTDPNQKVVTRFFKSNFVERFFLAPMNANYHVEHHELPYASFRKLPTAHERIMPYSRDYYIEENSYISFYYKNFIKEN